MSKFKAALVMAALIGTVSAASAHATTIDFNSNPNNTYFVPSVTSNGFLATENLLELGYDTPMGTNVAIDGVGPSNGTVHLDSWTNYGSNSVWTLSQVGGAAFSLSSFDFASAAYYSYLPAVSLTITGTRADNSTVSQTYLPVAGGFQTLQVSPAFSNVKSVEFNAFGFQNRSAYDNIVVGAAAVPEPAAWAMMILGMGVIGYSLRRAKRRSDVKFDAKIERMTAGALA